MGCRLRYSGEENGDIAAAPDRDPRERLPGRPPTLQCLALLFFTLEFLFQPLSLLAGIQGNHP